MQKRVRVITFFIIAVLATTLLPNSGMYAKAELGEEKETLEIELGEVKVNNVDNEVEIDVNIVNTEIETGEDVFQENKEFGLESNILENEKSIDCVIGKNWTLEQDETITGNLYINNGTIDLNGHTLTVYKDVIHAGGTLYINGGKLNIEGDFRIQKKLVNEEGKVIYKESYGVLKMTNPNDHVLVMGDFVMQNYYQTKDSKVLSDGVLEIKGDFTQIACGVTPSFYACENHKVILSGTKLQRITMEETYSRFNILELKNTSEEGVVFLTPISEWKLESDQVVSGDVVVGVRTIDLNGYTLRIKGDLIHPQGTLFINGGKLIVEGDYRIQTKSVDEEGNV
ncbi:hypothetical protein M972_111358 [Acetivibrio thermocellus AD2]|jgi:hypothetical protein|uniref:Organic solvent tolerance-like N-terminal domain-containing protein n=1 Tax=Acetivibrio thermocellus AD2 TaxID=1138384 RepID=A0AB36TF95_ACETH